MRRAEGTGAAAGETYAEVLEGIEATEKYLILARSYGSKMVAGTYSQHIVCAATVIELGARQPSATRRASASMSAGPRY